MIFGSKYGEEPAEEQHHKANASHAHYYGRAKKLVQATRKLPCSSFIKKHNPQSDTCICEKAVKATCIDRRKPFLLERDPFSHNSCKHSDFNTFIGMDTKQQNNMRFSNKLCLAAPMDVVLKNKEIKHMKLLQWEKAPNLHLHAPETPHHLKYISTFIEIHHGKKDPVARGIQHTVTRQAHRKLEPDFHDKYGNLILLSGVAFGIGTWAYKWKSAENFTEEVKSHWMKQPRKCPFVSHTKTSTLNDG
ncbi:Cytochrome c oxidase subunit 7B, mitochondrial, partial [Ophiophagus hannah]